MQFDGKGGTLIKYLFIRAMLGLWHATRGRLFRKGCGAAALP